MQLKAKKTKSIYGDDIVFEERITPRQRVGAWVTRVVLWIMCLVVLFPVIIILSASLSPGSSFVTSILPKSISFENYIGIFTETDFLLWVKNSMILSVSVAVIQLILTVPAAFAFSKLRFKFRSGGLMGLLILQMFPTTMALPAIITVCLKMEEVINIDGMNNLFVIILLLAGGSAYNIWLMKGYMDGIPTELTEAAYVDGATTLQVFIKIILPLMRNMLLVVFLFAFINTYSEFVFSKSLLRNKEVQTLATGLQSFIKDEFASNWTQYSAAAILSSVPVVALFMALQKFLATGLTAGSVKG